MKVDIVGIQEFLFEAGRREWEKNATGMTRQQKYVGSTSATTLYVFLLLLSWRSTWQQLRILTAPLGSWVSNYWFLILLD